MGRPKQLLDYRGESLVELAAAALAPHVEAVVLLGAGEVPAALRTLPRLADAMLPRAEKFRVETARSGGGPLAGMLAAFDHRPAAAWVFAPCDLPLLRPAAVAWLLSQRREDRWAVLPRPVEGGPVSPLLALYEPPARRLLAELAAAGTPAPRLLAADPRVATPVPPPELAGCWRGVNTPQELAALERRPPDEL
jgi:molybdopterin-guanine dinucleotide biosynthesis protein A